MNKSTISIGTKVYYIGDLNIEPGFYTIDSEQMTDYSWGSDDDYYYFKEVTNKYIEILPERRIRAWSSNIINLSDLIVCSLCGNTCVQEVIWIDPNTKETLGNEGLECLDPFCKDCGQTVNLITRFEWEKIKEIQS
jgi:hypothetical protein